MSKFVVSSRLVVFVVASMVCAVLATGCGKSTEDQPAASPTPGAGGSPAAMSAPPQVRATMQAAQQADVAQRAARAGAPAPK